MTFARKLTLACLAVALTLGAVFFLLLQGRKASREIGLPAALPAAEDEAAPAATVALEEVPRAAPVRRERRGARAAPTPAFEEGGWLIVGRAVQSTGPAGPGATPDEPAAAESVPVAGVRLVLRGHPRKTRPGEAPPPREVVTGADGTFALENVPGRISLRLDLGGEGFADRALSFRLEEPDYGAKLDLGDIPLEPGSTLVVELAGPDGQPVSGGRVLVGRESGGRTEELQRLGLNDSRREASDEGKGRYVLERAMPGPHRIEVLAPHCAPAREEVVLPKDEPVRFRLAEGGRIAGTILTSEGKPIDGASVEVNGSGLLEPDPVVPADASGEFLVDFLGSGNHSVTAQAEGYASERRTGIPAGTEGVDFQLEKEAVLPGKVVAEDGGAPVAGARISLEGAKVPVTAVSDESGAFTLRKIAPGSYRLLVDHPEYAPHRDEEAFDTAAGEKLPARVVRLGSGIVLEGHVLDAEGREPIHGATVRLAPVGQGGSSGRKKAATDGEGAFEARALAPATYDVTATARGYIPSSKTTVPVGAEGTDGVEIVLERASSISGTVLDPDRRPVRGAQIRPNLGQVNDFRWGSDQRLFEMMQGVAETDGEGRFTLEGIHPFPGYVLRATHPDFATVLVPGIAVGAREAVDGVEIVLSLAGELRGRVVDEKGNPLGGAGVSVHPSTTSVSLMYDTEGSPSATTNSEGKFEIRRLAAGTYTVRAGAKDRETASRDGIEVSPGRPGEEIEITVGPGVALAGRVLDDMGAPVAGVNLYSWSGSNNRQTASDAEGRFEMKGLTAGPIEIQVNKSGYARTRVNLAAPGKDVEIRVERSGKVRGTVRGSGGEPAAGVNISTIPRGARSSGYYGGGSTTTSPSGTYEIDVAKGTWVLRATGGGRAPGSSAEIEVLPGDSLDGIDIELPDGGTIEGHVFLAGSGAPVEGANVAYAGAASEPWGISPQPVSSRSDGSFVIEGVPEGEVTVTASHPEYAPGIATGVRAQAGGKTSVRIELRAGGAVRGRAVRGGNAVAGGWVNARSRGAGGASTKNTQTGPDGTFELKGLAPGEYLVTVAEPGRNGFQLRRTVTVIEGQTVDIDMAEGAGVRLSGRIISAGGVIPGGRVQAMRLDRGADGGSSSEIAPNGEYSLDLPGPGTYTLMVGFGPGGGTKLDVIVPPGSADMRQDIELPSGRAGGVVVDAASGEPIPRVEVGAFLAGQKAGSILSLYRSMQVMSRSDDAGRFVLSNLPDGSYELRAFAKGFIQVRRTSIQVTGSGAARESRVEMQKALSFRALVEDPSGRPLQNATAILRDGEGSIVLSGSPARSGQDGILEIEGASAGSYRITVSHAAYAARRLMVEVLEDGSVSPEPVFRLERGGKVRVRVTAGREPVDGATVEVLGESGEDLMDDAGFFFQEAAMATGPDGLIEVGPLPPGAYTLSAVKDGKRSGSEKITVREGETADGRVAFE